MSNHHQGGGAIFCILYDAKKRLKAINLYLHGIGMSLKICQSSFNKKCSYYCFKTSGNYFSDRESCED